MLSLPLLKKNFKENDRLWLLSAGILTVFTLLMVGMYDPSLEEHLRALAASLPEAVQGALGIQVVENSMTGFLSAYLFGFLFLALPLIYEIVLARRLVERLVKKGTMAYLLNTVVSRKKLIITQGYYLAVSLFALFFYGGGAGRALSVAGVPGGDGTVHLLSALRGGFLPAFFPERSLLCGLLYKQQGSAIPAFGNPASPAVLSLLYAEQSQ